MQRRRKSTRYLAASAILCAISVILLALGALIEVLDLSMAALASLAVVFAVIEMKGKYPYLIYAVTSVLALLLLPVKTPALIYALFAGYYPIVKARCEGHLKKPLAWLVKLIVFGVGLFVAVFLSLRFFLPSETVAAWHYWLLLIGMPVFVLYDVALTRLITVYYARWRRRFVFFRDE
ncbi:MAG: hypothetical protein E7663_05535 [Ruminococcaceae bacterium]|nr:hypothetical protein [Oscillospiraceae bacterium]